MEASRLNGGYDSSDVEGIETLKNEIRQMYDSDDPVDYLADLFLNGHDGVSGYLTFGNNKIAKNTGIFNMNSATDCPNAKSGEDNESEVGACQVPWNDCYAHVTENIYDDALKKRRLQEYLWDNVDAMTFAEALLRVKERKRSAFEHLRVSESGDFRHRSDIVKWDRIAQRLGDSINIYTYSASHKLDWSEAQNFTVNQSNNLADYGDRLFTAVPQESDIPDDAIFCPFEAAKKNGIETDNRPKCGECEKCIHPESEQPRSVYITIH